jgi:hypothetical protein
MGDGGQKLTKMSSSICLHFSSLFKSQHSSYFVVLAIEVQHEITSNTNTEITIFLSQNNLFHLKIFQVFAYLLCF